MRKAGEVARGAFSGMRDAGTRPTGGDWNTGSSDELRARLWAVSPEVSIKLQLSLVLAAPCVGTQPAATPSEIPVSASQ